MKIYIAGPITGMFDYKEKFTKAEKYLKEMGHTVINPSFLPEGLKDYMPTCKAMIDQSDGVYFLCGWEDSKGAMEERAYAVTNSKEIFEENPFE